MELDVVLEDPRWEECDLSGLCQTALSAVFETFGLGADVIEISVLGANDARIANLNADFRGKATPTNVLSWPTQEITPPAVPQPDFDGMIALGDIALAYETCMREATEQNKSPADHVLHLIVHGAMHLLGYDHQSDIEATLMEGLETKILGKLGVDDPYS